MKRSTGWKLVGAVGLAMVAVVAGIQLWDAGVVPPSNRGATQYSVSFVESGLPSGSPWRVTFADHPVAASAPSGISFSASDGIYPFQVDPEAGFSYSPRTGNVTVNGGSATVSVTFNHSGAPIQHVVEILLEDSETGHATNNSAYLAYLAGAYGSASAFYGVCHGSLPNYVALVSAYYTPCGNASIGQLATADLPDLLEAGGYSWAGYFEGMPVPCDRNDAAAYHVDHNPFLNFNDIVSNTARCNAHILNSRAFNSSVRNGSLPTFSFYVPSIYDDCRPETSSVPVCSAWLQGLLTPILNSTDPPVQALAAHTVFVVTFDEGSTDRGYSVGNIADPWCQNTTGKPLSVCGGHLYFDAISPYSMGTAFVANATDFNVESTVEWLFGLGSDGGYDGSSGFPSMSSLFSFSTNS